MQRLALLTAMGTLWAATLPAQPSAPAMPAAEPGFRCVIAPVSPAVFGASTADIDCLGGFPRGHATRHFDIRGDYAALSVPVAELGALFDEVYAYVSERTGIRVNGLIPVTVQSDFPGICPPRGRASNSRIELFADGTTSRAQLLGVLGHELGHVLQFRELPGALWGPLGQGYASWAAGRYWTEWQGYESFHAAVSVYMATGSFLPLSSPDLGFEVGEGGGDSAECLARRDIVLNEWASLVEYLMESYGRDELYRRAAAPAAPAAAGVDYLAILGRDFEQIEADWLESVRDQPVVWVGVDVSGAGCILNGEEVFPGMPPATAQAEAMRREGLPLCPPGIPPLPEVALGHGTQHFDIRGWREDLGMPVEELGAQFDEIYAYVSARTGLGVQGLIPVMVLPGSTRACPVRGRAWHSGIELFVDIGWSREQWQGVLAHELGHVLQHRERPAISRFERSLSEGFATWASGRYWTAWQGQASLHAAVRDYLERQVFLELSTPPNTGGFGEEESGSTTDCIAQRYILYTEWASLIDYLVESFGREGFYSRTDAAPDPRPRAYADYSGVFDRSFEQLEADWLDAARAQR